MAEDDLSKMICNNCGYAGFEESEGFYHCIQCGTRADDVMDTGVGDEDFVGNNGDTRGAIYQATNTRQRPSQPMTQPTQPTLATEETQQHSQFWSQFEPTEPADFGSGTETVTITSEDYYREVRKRYVMGLQMMIQYQCETLVKEFNVTPLICGLVGPIWLRFVALSGVFNESWGDEAIKDSEVQSEGEAREDKLYIRNKSEPHNLYGKRAVLIWVKSLRASLPLSSSLAICFLACHVARASILPTDLVRWARQGKIPYLSCFVRIRKQMGERSPACPVSASIMFKPSQVISPQRLETRAAYIAEEIGLNLPPVNFYAIAAHYLKELSLPSDKILPQACRIENWSMPPDLYLSKNECRLPTRVCVMSILIVTIRILYNINGFGVWEQSLCKDSSSKMEEDVSEASGSSDDDKNGSEKKSATKSSGFVETEFNTEELLKNLEAKYHEVAQSSEHEKGLLQYIQHGKDVVFAGSEESSPDNMYKIIQELWNQYLIGKDLKGSGRIDIQLETPAKRKRSQDDNISLDLLSLEENTFSDERHHHNPSNSGESILRIDSDQEQDPEPENHTSPEKVKESAVRRLKRDMEENVFCYISPRVKVKRLDYLHYVRKKEKGALNYVAHADYYILLRVCAKVAEVDVRIMHLGVLSLERRLAWLEKRIEYCLDITPPSMTCKNCSHVGKDTDELDEDDTFSI
ncbi:PREDICTED: TATA box-binding protein-associated factor RNA polymerase I subunit B isoform X2 [Tarenaya hassleriana]|uniref:TATA box-binding protein-associated factor RNA polymerase I subunit B isoform X2 n=1 Tax=Tarenaya hassleriana TaxID=28532 RepID=UPI00053C9519|nr:PREDICTED: TATA box-binding protein-associated factor RNA polymerase I subunit B isoform X2 [Tarenaya hassleriana]